MIIRQLILVVTSGQMCTFFGTVGLPQIRPSSEEKNKRLSSFPERQHPKWPRQDIGNAYGQGNSYLYK